MGLITNLLKEKHDQEWREQNLKLTGLSQIIGSQDPSIRPETKSSALSDLVEIIEGKQGKKSRKQDFGPETGGHHPIKAILGSMAGIGDHLGLPGMALGQGPIQQQDQGQDQGGPVPAQPGPQQMVPDSLKTQEPYDLRHDAIPVTELPMPPKPMFQQQAQQQAQQAPQQTQQATPQTPQASYGGGPMPQTAQGAPASPQLQEQAPQGQQQGQQPWWRGKLTYTPEELEAQQLKQEQHKIRIAAQIEREQRSVRRAAMIEAGVDPNSDAGKMYELKNDLPTQFGNPAKVGSAGAAENTRNITVTTPDGKKISAVQGIKTGTLYDLNHNEIDLPEGSTIAAGGAGGRPVQDPAQFRLWKQAYVSQGFPEKEAEQMAGQLLLRSEDTMIGGRVAGAIAHTQQAGQQKALSGIGGYMPSGGIPNAGGGGARGPAIGSGGGGSKGVALDTATGVTPSQTPPKKTGTGRGATLPSASTPMSPAKIQAAIDNDPQMSLAVDQMLRLTPGGRGGAAGAVGAEIGIRRLTKITGLSKPELQTELTARQGVTAAVKLGQQRASGFDQAARFVDQMGKLVLQAKQQMGGGDTERFMQRVKNHWNQNYHGDPATDAMVTALNGFQSAYSRAISGGQLSVAQTQVAAQERAGKLLDAAMKSSEMKVVIAQAGKELLGEKTAIDNNNSSQRKLLMQPFGAFVRGPEAPSDSTSPSGSEERIQVTAPDGRTGSIPKSKLDEAIKRGYKRIQ